MKKIFIYWQRKTKKWKSIAKQWDELKEIDASYEGNYYTDTENPLRKRSWKIIDKTSECGWQYREEF